MKVLNIESQMPGNEASAIYLAELIKVAKEAGYTHVWDHWGQNAHDEYTIDEAIEVFKYKPELFDSDGPAPGSNG